MRTLATACDGVVECLNGEDETWICTNRERPIWIVLGCLGLVLVVVVGLKYRELRPMKKDSSKIPDSSPPIGMKRVGWAENFDFVSEIREGRDTKSKCNVVLLSLL